MPGWSEVLGEIKQEEINNKASLQANPAALVINPTDKVRKKYLSELSAHTGRNVFLYASCWLQKSQIPGDLITVHPSDMDGFLESVKGVDTDLGLDLILHSPGGSPEAAEQIVNYLRQKFDSIRVIVPMMAMSAATMMACAADSIVLARHSTLGPTDPQLTIRTNTGELRMVPAYALKAEFEKAEIAGTDGDGKYAAWAPLIGQYSPGLLTLCNSSQELTAELVGKWLAAYMFKGDAAAAEIAGRLAAYFGQPEHHTHGRPLMRDQLKDEGLVVEDLEDDDKFQDLVMSVYHAATHTLGGTNVVKIIENSMGRSYMRAV